jgi:hypothetical protein
VNEEMMDRMYRAHQLGKLYHKIWHRWTSLHNDKSVRTVLKYIKRKKGKAIWGKTLFKGSYLYKVQKIKEFTLQKSDEDRNLGATVHDLHLQASRLQSAKVVDWNNVILQKHLSPTYNMSVPFHQEKSSNLWPLKKGKLKDILKKLPVSSLTKWMWLSWRIIYKIMKFRILIKANSAVKCPSKRTLNL